MESPLDYAKTFARIWELERPPYIEESPPPDLLWFLDLVQEAGGEIVSGGRGDDLRRIGEGEFSQ